MSRILIFAAHPDDEILGCGGFISKYGKEFNIKVVFLGEGSSCRFEDFKSEEAFKEIKKRKEFAKKAMGFIGVDDYSFYDLPCGRFDQIPILEINKIMEKEINTFNPQIIFTHSASDANNDHKIVNKSSIMSTRPGAKNRVEKLIEYEVLSSTEWSFSKVFKPNFFEILSEKDVEIKYETLSIYQSEVKKYPFPRSRKGIKNLAMIRGMQVGAEYAEGYKIIREIKT